MIIGDIETNEKIEYEDLLKNYYEKMEIIEEQDKEIERLKKENAILKQTMCDESLLINENALLKDIIKEVREYIEKHKHLNWYNDSCYMNDLLEILDKTN